MSATEGTSTRPPVPRGFKYLGAMLFVAIVVGVGLVAPPLGCNRYSPPTGLPTVQIKLGTKTYTVEIAANDTDRQRGLMQRDSMPAEWGMIFVFPDEEMRGFWMKNTRIALDIIYVAGDGKVVSIHQMKPYDLNSTSSKGPAKYAIELNEGEAAKAGLKEGDVLVIPAAAAKTDQ